MPPTIPTTAVTEVNVDEVDDLTQIREYAKGLARDLKATRGKLDSIEPQYQSLVMKGLGLDPESPKAQGLLQLHGDGEFTIDALKATAEQFQYDLGASPDGTQPQGGDQAAPAAPATPPQLTTEQQATIAASQRGAQAQAVGSPVAPQTVEARIGEALEKGDVRTSLALKGQALAARFAEGR